MGGTVKGGKRAAATNMQKYGDNFYKELGRKGGSKTKAQGCKPKGFAANPQLAREVGRIGGTISKRKPSTYKAKGIILEERKQKHNALLDVFKRRTKA